MTAYYNEIDGYAAQWLRNLIVAGHIAPGDVDTRSIEDVTPDDLRGYTQCHFFAGIGVWSHALRLAGWPDDRPVWTGSCPCQPFSAAGKKGGIDDERHLWPAFFHLIDYWRPPVVLGEQVASKDGLLWLDLVSADMEGAGYAFGASDLCAAGIGAPHIRQRLWFVGASDAARSGRGEECSHGRGLPGRGGAQGLGAGCSSSSSTGGVADNQSGGSGTGLRDHGQTGDGQRFALLGDRGPIQRVADGDDARLEGRGESGRECPSERSVGTSGLAGGSCDRDGRPGPTNGFWGDADWLYCRDGRWRPVEPGTFPLAHGATARVGRLRAYGNAIVADVAATFIAAVLDILDARVVLPAPGGVTVEAEPLRELIG